MRRRVVHSFRISLAGLLLAAVLARGDTFYVANSGNNSVDTISTTSGASLQPFARNVSGACAVACDWQGNVYSLDLNQGRVYKITKAGVVAVMATGLNGPEALAFNSQGDLFVVNQGGTVTRITRAGVISAFAKLPDELYGVAIDADDNLYVSNHNSGTISKITRSGLVSPFANLSSVSPGSGFSPSTVGAITYVGSTVTSGGGSLTFGAPRVALGVVAFDPHGTLFVAEQSTGTVYKVDKSGSSSPFATGLADPTDIAFDSHGEMFVAGGSRGVFYEINPAGVVSMLASGLPRIYGLASSHPLYKLAAALDASELNLEPSPHLPAIVILALCAPAIVLLVGGLLWLAFSRRNRRI